MGLRPPPPQEPNMRVFPHPAQAVQSSAWAEPVFTTGVCSIGWNKRPYSKIPAALKSLRINLRRSQISSVHHHLNRSIFPRPALPPAPCALRASGGSAARARHGQLLPHGCRGGGPVRFQNGGVPCGLVSGPPDNQARGGEDREAPGRGAPAR